MLDILGLTPDQEALYEVLVARRPLTETEVAELAPDRSVVAGLVELGLVTVTPTEPPRFVVVPPETALTRLVDARDRELARLRQQLIALTVRFHGAASRRDPTDLMEVVAGEDMHTMCHQVLMPSARREFRGWDSPPYANDYRQTNTAEMDLLRAGVRCRVVYDRGALVGQSGRLADLVASIQHGEEARVADVPHKLFLSDHPMALLPLDLRATRLQNALLIHDPTMCHALQAHFDLHWERAVPLATFRAETLEPDAGPTLVEGQLLLLLLSGFTDRQMAVHLGCGERTIRQRLIRMRDRLDAQTRFQAGYQAVLRGWLTADDVLADVTP